MSNLQTPNCQTAVAGADLRGHWGKIVAFDGAKRLVPCTVPGASQSSGGPIGVCYSNVGSLQAAAYAIQGNTEVYTQNTLAPGDFITANSVSLATPATSGSVAIGQVHQYALPGAIARVELVAPFRHTGANLP